MYHAKHNRIIFVSCSKVINSVLTPIFFLSPGLSSRTGFAVTLLKRFSTFRFLCLWNSNIHTLKYRKMSRSLHIFLLLSSSHTSVYHRILESFRWESTSVGNQFSLLLKAEPTWISDYIVQAFRHRLHSLSSCARDLTGLLGPILESSFRENFSLSSHSLLCFRLWLLSHSLTDCCLSFSLTFCRYGQGALSYPQSKLFLQA